MDCSSTASRCWKRELQTTTCCRYLDVFFTHCLRLLVSYYPVWWFRAEFNRQNLPQHAPKSWISRPLAAVRRAQVIRRIQAHTSNPRWTLFGLLLKSSALIFITIPGRAGSDSRRSLCTRQSAHSHPTTMELACGHGRLRLDKYASVPQRRCSYFHRFVWECKFMCVIPVYYISAPGQNKNEYSHMHGPAHTQLLLFKVNKHGEGWYFNLRIQVRCRWCNPWADARWSRSHICSMWACCRFLHLNAIPINKESSLSILKQS